MPEPDALEIFATNLRRLRKEKGWSQERLAEEAGLHFTDVSRIERAVRDPGVRTVAKLAKGLGTEPAALHARSSSEPSDQAG